MRQLYAKKEFIASNGATVIRTADKTAIYLLVGKWGLKADTLSLYTISGTLEAELKQEGLGFGATFQIRYHQQVVGRLSKTFGVIREVLFIRGLRWVVMGNTLTGHYRILHGTEEIATIQTLASSDGAVYEFTTDQQWAEPIVICVAAVLDHWSKRQSRLPAWRATLLPSADPLKPATFRQLSNTFDPHKKPPLD